MFSKLILIFLFTAFVAGQAFAIPLGEILKLGAETTDSLAVKFGVDNLAAKKAKDSLKMSLRALNNGVDPKDMKTVKSIFSFDKKLVAILDKDVNDISGREFAAIINRAAEHAEMFGKSAYMMCSTCVDDSLYKLGIRALSQPASEQASKILSKIPTNPSSLNQSLKQSASRLKIKNADQIIGSLKDREKRKFYVFLQMARSGSPDEKEFANALLAFNEGRGASYITKNDLWMMSMEDMQSVYSKNWSKRLREIAKEEPMDERGRIGNLERWLERKAANDSELSDDLAKLKERKCWGLFR